MSKRFSNKKRKQVWEKSNGLRWYCGIALIDNGNASTNSFHLDHFINRNNDMNNLVPACQTCNLAKSNRTIEAFRIILSRHFLGYIKFSSPQIIWLKKHNIEIPKQEMFKFWYEKEIRNE